MKVKINPPSTSLARGPFRFNFMKRYIGAIEKKPAGHRLNGGSVATTKMDAMIGKLILQIRSGELMVSLELFELNFIVFIWSNVNKI
jgi:hypothetical protein